MVRGDYSADWESKQEDSAPLYNAIAACRDAGIIVVAASANDRNDNDSTPHYPSSYLLSKIVSIASSTAEDHLSGFSITGRYSVGYTLLPFEDVAGSKRRFVFQTGATVPAGPMYLFLRNSSLNNARVYLDELVLSSATTETVSPPAPVTVVSGPPNVRITSPGNRTGVIIDTSIQIAGEANDAKDGAALALSCRVDGVEIATATGGSFSFTVPVTNRAGHVVEVSTMDSDGFRSSDAIVLDTITSQPPNLLGRLAPVALEEANVAVLDGAFFLQTSRSLFQSYDGLNWIQMPVPSGFDGPIAAGNGRLVSRVTGSNSVFASLDGMRWIQSYDNEWALSSDDERTWVLGPTPEPFVDLLSAGDRDFGFGEFGAVYVTADGQQWTPCTGNLPTPPRVVGHILTSPIHFGLSAGRYVCYDGTSMTWSVDGLHWQPGIGGPPSDHLDSLAGNKEAIVAVFRSGAVWRSTDGIAWVEVLPAPTPRSESLSQQMVRLGSNLIIGGGTSAYQTAYSEDDGRTWSNSFTDGSPTIQFVDLEVGGPLGSQVALGRQTISGGAVYRSTDGALWTEIPELADLTINSLASNETNTWAAVASDGRLFRSNDNALTWFNIPSPLNGLAVAIYWSNGRWILLGGAGNGQPCRAWASTNLTTWSDYGPTGFSAYSSPPTRVVQAHGITTVDGYWFSDDDRNWTLISTGDTYAVPTPTGWLLYGDFLNETSIDVWSYTPTGQLLEQGVIPYQGYEHIAAVDDRYFLFARGRVSEWYRYDLDLIIAEPFAPPADLGVGDQLAVPVTLTNRGDRDWLGGDLEFAVTLSNNSFLGDGDDIPLGFVTVPTPTIAPGANETLQLISTLTDTLRGGDFHVFVRADPHWLRPDYNGSNNADRSDAATLTIQEWELNLDTAGDGTIDSDSFRRFYPHNFQVPLLALAGKGSAFTGWSGDAVGAHSETSILMNADRSVTANFSTLANLHLTVRGGGTVTGQSEDSRYMVGSTATLEALPLPGWTFLGWEGDLRGADPNAVLVMQGNRVVTARFVLLLPDWRALHFNPQERADLSVSGDAADPDRDLVPNWCEYLHGSDPRDASQTGTIASLTSANFYSIRFTRLESPEPGHALRVTSSPDLLQWLPDSHEERILEVRDGIETVEARLPLRPLRNGFLRFEYFR